MRAPMGSRLNLGVRRSTGHAVWSFGSSSGLQVSDDGTRQVSIGWGGWLVGRVGHGPAGNLTGLELDIVDPVADYKALMESLFDFDAIRAMFAAGFAALVREVDDALFAVAGLRLAVLVLRFVPVALRVPVELAARPDAPGSRGYEVFSDWNDNARKLDPMSIDWRGVANGTVPVRMPPMMITGITSGSAAPRVAIVTWVNDARFFFSPTGPQK